MRIEQLQERVESLVTQYLLGHGVYIRQGLEPFSTLELADYMHLLLEDIHLPDLIIPSSLQSAQQYLLDFNFGVVDQKESSKVESIIKLVDVLRVEFMWRYPISDEIPLSRNPRLPLRWKLHQKRQLLFCVETQQGFIESLGEPGECVACVGTPVAVIRSFIRDPEHPRERYPEMASLGLDALIGLVTRVQDQLSFSEWV